MDPRKLLTYATHSRFNHYVTYLKFSQLGMQVYLLQLFHVTTRRYWTNQGTCVVPNDVMSLLVCF